MAQFTITKISIWEGKTFSFWPEEKTIVIYTHSKPSKAKQGVKKAWFGDVIDHLRNARVIWVLRWGQVARLKTQAFKKPVFRELYFKKSKMKTTKDKKTNFPSFLKKH